MNKHFRNLIIYATVVNLIVFLRLYGAIISNQVLIDITGLFTMGEGSEGGILFITPQFIARMLVLLYIGGYLIGKNTTGFLEKAKPLGFALIGVIILPPIFFYSIFILMVNGFIEPEGFDLFDFSQFLFIAGFVITAILAFRLPNQINRDQRSRKFIFIGLGMIFVGPFILNFMFEWIQQLARLLASGDATSDVFRAISEFTFTLITSMGDLALGYGAFHAGEVPTIDESEVVEYPDLDAVGQDDATFYAKNPQ